MSDPLFICNLEDIADPGSYGFSLYNRGQKIEGFVVHKDGELFAYVNECPHTGSPLDWVEHQFLDMDLDMIQCAVHDARFEIRTGQCLVGPCPGESLQKLDIEQRLGGLYLIDRD
jgi:nitrite reductase/ring-hydroxylating ferredoxin subunit